MKGEAKAKCLDCDVVAEGNADMVLSAIKSHSERTKHHYEFNMQDFEFWRTPVNW